MLLAINIGNSNIRFGAFSGSDCVSKWLINTKPLRSADEYSATVSILLKRNKVKKSIIDGIIIGSVVPALSPEIRKMCEDLFGIEPVFISYRMPTGLRYPIEKPEELGADLLANAAAAFHLYKKDCIVVDFGTALSFTVTRADGYLSGIVIAPGVISALGSLVGDTAQLPQIELKEPERVIGIDTVGCIQSGMIYGYTGLIENIIKKIDEEQGSESKVIATGGASGIFRDVSSRIDLFDELHTLKGLQLLHGLSVRK